MNQYMRKALVFLACILAQPALAAPKLCTPSALDVLTRVVQAHKNLGPVTMHCTIVTSKNGKTIPVTIVGVVKRNDRAHSLTTSCMRIRDLVLGRIRVYVNEVSTVTYNETSHEYKRGKVEDPSKLSPLIEDIADSLASPRERARLAKIPVQPAKIDGMPIWRLSWPTTAPTKGPVRVTIVVGQSDSLLHKFVFSQKNGDAISVATTYKREKQPFPAETFEFVPTCGAREATR